MLEYRILVSDTSKTTAEIMAEVPEMDQIKIALLDPSQTVDSVMLTFDVDRATYSAVRIKNNVFHSMTESEVTEVCDQAKKNPIREFVDVMMKSSTYTPMSPDQIDKIILGK